MVVKPIGVMILNLVHDTCTSGASIKLLIVCREQLTLGLKILTPNLVSGLPVADG